MENETVWLTQELIVIHFEKIRTVIVRQINNIYKCGELVEISTCAKNAQVQIEGNRQITRLIPYYNLYMNYEYALPLVAQTEFPEALIMNDKLEEFLEYQIEL